jgi:hypothetical protein
MGFIPMARDSRWRNNRIGRKMLNKLNKNKKIKNILKELGAKDI